MWLNYGIIILVKNIAKMYQNIITGAHELQQYSIEYQTISCHNLQSTFIQRNEIDNNSRPGRSINPSFMQVYSIICEWSHNLIGPTGTIYTWFWVITCTQQYLLFITPNIGYGAEQWNYNQMSSHFISTHKNNICQLP